MYYKLGQDCVKNWGSFILLQIRPNVVTNWGSFITTNWSNCCYKLRQLLQIRPTVITKQDSYYKLGQNVLQIGAGITNQGNYYKLGHSRRNLKTCELFLALINLILEWFLHLSSIFKIRSFSNECGHLNIYIHYLAYSKLGCL